MNKDLTKEDVKMLNSLARALPTMGKLQKTYFSGYVACLHNIYKEKQYQESQQQQT